jgi:hypothetical protein
VLALWTLLSISLAPPAALLPRAPALVAPEVARYRVTVGPFGVGEIVLTLASPAPTAPNVHLPAALLHARGAGSGSILGLGRQEGQVDIDFDRDELASRRWTMTRLAFGHTTRDEVEQPAPGHLDMARVRDGAPAGRRSSQIGAPVLDPLGFLLRLRGAPPARAAGPEVLRLLDGQALWQVKVARGAPVSFAAQIPARAIVRLEGRADPIHYDGRPDVGERVSHPFVLWLAADRTHVPLRLEMPLGPSQMVVALVSVERTLPPPTIDPPRAGPAPEVPKRPDDPPPATALPLPAPAAVPLAPPPPAPPPAAPPPAAK